MANKRRSEDASDDMAEVAFTAEIEGLDDLLAVDPEVRKELRILLIDDDRALCDSCATVLSTDGYNAEVCYRGDEALRRLRSRTYDIVLIDLYMSQVSGMELLRTCIEVQAHALAIVITGKPSVSSSLEALRAGAWDYLPKPFSASHIQLLIGRAAHAAAVARERQEVQQELQQRHGHSDKLTVVGVSPALRKVVELARKVARTDASAFITGESGTGKELIARFIHEHGRRSSRPMVAVNCAALPAALLESEMFGHVRGAFTGAVEDKPGLLESANGGTLFLDELPEMEPALQAKLLRVIQDGMVRRVGSTKTDAVVNVRFIAATNVDPRRAIEDGTLRKDLYFRLNVVPIELPPLRERTGDIPILARMFFAQYWRRHREPGSTPPVLSAEVLEALESLPWHGNVRELQNVMEHAVVLFEEGNELRPEHLLPVLEGTEDGHRGGRSGGGDPFGAFIDGDYHVARDRLVGEFERKYLARVIDLAEGNMTRAARLASVDRTTLYRLLEKHNLTVQRLLSEDEEEAEEPNIAATN